jgi:hypothetical protein
MPPNLFEANTAKNIEQRIHSLSATSARQWGQMSVSQMMAHLRTVLQLATGERTEKPQLIGKLLGPFIKRVVFSPKPYKPGLPTGTGFVIKEDKNFDQEKQQLIATYEKFIAAGPTAVDGLKHPLFGKLTADEWGFSQWKHFDHHLRQFGA